MAIVKSRANDLAIAKMEREWSEQRERIAELESIIRYCQDILTEHSRPDGVSSDDAIFLLLETLDGPRTRSVLPNKQ
jgi:hypothetical protein